MITVEWDAELENTVVMRYADPVRDWQEYHTASDAANELIKSRNGKVHLIHLAGRTKMPPGNPFPHIRSAVRAIPSNCESVVMVLDNLMAQRILELVMSKLFGRTIKFARSLNEAHTFLKSLAG
ncbi:MAG: hypothetical protein IAE83_15955 [Anaerolinea sp.]|nr:hypothetical protein [Anaerolinea sp.]MCC6974957.1 hypothetical protein [Anaerolineae bacterium]CAG0957442.1 hypothetical protein ANRL4_00461 [Anaerolineae bacterium]